MTETETKEATMKMCKGCRRSLVVNDTNFYKMGAGRKYFSARCKPCDKSAQASKYVKKNHHMTKLEGNDELREEAQTMLENGTSYSRIAYILGLAPLTVKKAIDSGILVQP